MEDESIEKQNALKLTATYDSIAEKYDSFAEKGLYKVPIWLKEKFEGLNFSKPNILDLGCANGYLGKIVKEKFENSSIVGVDISPKMIEELKKGELYDNAVIWDLNAGLPAVEAGIFDIVLAFGVFEFIKNPSSALKRVGEAMKTHGRFFTSFECFNPKKHSEKIVTDSRIGFPRYSRSLKDVQDLLKEAKLEIVVYNKVTAYKSPTTGIEIDYFMCEIKRDRNV